jgi:hypothetical protein
MGHVAGAKAVTVLPAETNTLPSDTESPCGASPVTTTHRAGHARALTKRQPDSLPRRRPPRSTNRPGEAVEQLAQDRSVEGSPCRALGLRVEDQPPSPSPSTYAGGLGASSGAVA